MLIKLRISLKVSVRSRMIVAVRSKFELLVFLIASYINVLMISETKINETFSNFTILHGWFFFTEVEKHMNRTS